MTIPILMYHNIAEAKRGYRLSSQYTSPQQFKRQMQTLSLLGYKGLSVGHLAPYLQSRRRAKVFGITFDDGYLDNYEAALPVLSSLNFSATCYMVAGQIGGSNVWTLGQRIRQAPLMGVDHLRRWVQAGMEIGSHTVSHPHLCTLSRGEAFKEICTSKTILEKIIDRPVSTFCYPYGEFNQSVMELVRDCGFTSATTTLRKRATREDPLLRLPRVHMTRRTSLGLLLLKCLGSYEDKHFNLGRML